MTIKTAPSMTALHLRWMNHSIRELTPPGQSPVETARWLCSARCALYAISAMRRQH